MANRGPSYGLSAQVKAKLSSKYNEEEEQKALRWIEAVLDEPTLFEGVTGESATHQVLKDGIILCKLMNRIQPGSIDKIHVTETAFSHMENIETFIKACNRYGLMACDLFETVALYEKQNMHNVIVTIFALGRKAQLYGDFQGPHLGPRESQPNVREFTEDQLKRERGTIGLQMGTNKCPSQSGMNFGKMRAILD